MTLLKRLSKTLVVTTIFLSLSFTSFISQAKEFVTIGTGGVTGVYYPTGGAICRLINKQKQSNIRCNIESTGGSIYNLNTLKAAEIDFGIVQSDWLHHAYHGTDAFVEQGANKNLRVVFSLYTEPLTIVARKDANIKTFEDLKNKRVNIGNPGSGQRANMEQLMRVYGWSEEDFKLVTSLKSSEQAQALCDNKIDAFAFVTGHPSGSIKEATTSCQTNLVSIEGPKIDNLIKQNTFIRQSIIPGGTYEGTPSDVKTYGVSAIVVTTTKEKDEVVYKMTKAISENLNDFTRLHQSLMNLTQEDMINVKGVPFHEGALRYYKEVGLK